MPQHILTAFQVNRQHHVDCRVFNPPITLYIDVNAVQEDDGIYCLQPTVLPVLHERPDLFSNSTNRCGGHFHPVHFFQAVVDVSHGHPLAYNVMILSSSSLLDVSYFFSSFGSYSPVLSRGTATST